MQKAINVLQKRMTEINERIKESEKVIDEPEMLCDIEFAMNDIGNYELDLIEICEAIQILKNAETLKNKKALLIHGVSDCKHENGCVTDKEGFEVCPDCGEWGENC